MMETWTDILLLVLMVICFITSGAAALWIVMELRARRQLRRDQETIQRMRGQ